ncbi:hypothetical protein KKF63_00945 [bacterium]|nr:hypothetical protein [bacterium]
MTDKTQNIIDYHFPLKSGMKDFLEMVPQGSKTRIIKMAHKAYAEMGNERSLMEFTDDMAKFWLMVKEELHHIVKAHDFKQENSFDIEEKKAVFLFTENGSFLAGSTADETEKRHFIYQKVQLLGNQNDYHCGAGCLKAKRYPRGLVDRTKILTDGTICAEVVGFIETTPIAGIFVGQADFEKLKIIVQLIKETIIDAGYFTQTG